MNDDPTHICPECGCTEQPNKMLDLNKVQSKNIKVFTIEKYMWAKTDSSGQSVYDNLYLVHDKDILASDHDDFINKLNAAKLLYIPVCPECFTAMLDWELAKKNSHTVLGIAFENAKTKPITALINKLQIDLLSQKGYGGQGFGCLAGILNGNNCDQMLEWLIKSEHWNPLVAQRIMEYAASYDWNEPKLSIANKTIKTCLSNGADWQADFNIAYLNRIIKMFENDPENESLFEDMLMWHFKRTTHTK